MTPGKKELNNFKDTKLFEQICGFIRPSGMCADIGPINEKIKYIAKRFDLEIIQADYGDFDTDSLTYFQLRLFHTIFCFEIVEHLTNPKFFIEQLIKALDKDGTIYLSMPARPKILWDEHHYNEISPKRFDKWILKPLGLKIIRKQRIRPTHSPLFYLKGFRPFLRLFLNYSWIYEIKKH